MKNIEVKNMTIAERNNKLKHLIDCLKCRVSGRPCHEDCSIQYDAGNMGEIIENLEAISEILEQEPITKNDLAVEYKAENCIDREIVSSYVESHIQEINTGYGDLNAHTNHILRIIVDYINKMPSVLPKAEWIPVTERLPKEHICNDGWHEPSDYVLVFTKCRCMHVTRWWSRFDERWVDLKYPTTDEVIAWMPLPKPYEPQESEE